MAMDRAAQPAPSPVTHHQKVAWLIGQLDQRRARRSPHHKPANRHAVRHTAERLVEGITHALVSLLLPQPEQQRAGGPQVGDLPADRSPGEHGQHRRPR